MKYLNISMVFCVVLLVLSCNDGPKVITATTNNTTTSANSGIFTEGSESDLETDFNPVTGTATLFTDNLHTVVATETLNTQKYVYIKATEGGKQFWIATAKQPIDIGKTYYYRNPLLKTNFESREHNRVFDTIYLVSQLVSHNHGSGNLKADFTTTETASSSQKQTIPTHTDEIIEHKGSLKISEIVDNPQKYVGKTVQVTGKCVKVNPNIMDRNWIHLQDGSKNSYDFVVTSNTFVPEGKTVTMRAEVSLDRDFGAGYKYDLILENGVVIE